MIYGEDGMERFSARLFADQKLLSILWTDHVPRTLARIRDVQQLAGGAGCFTRINGTASDKLEVSIRSGSFDTNKAAEMLGKILGGTWSVSIMPRPDQIGVFDIEGNRS